MKRILYALPVLLGIGIAYVDSRPSWDDTGITAVSLLLVSGLTGLLDPPRPWLLALAIGIWTPLAGILLTHNYGGLVALVFALAGVYSGVFVRRIFTRDNKTL